VKAGGSRPSEFRMVFLKSIVLSATAGTARSRSDSVVQDDAQASEPSPRCSRWSGDDGRRASHAHRLSGQTPFIEEPSRFRTNAEASGRGPSFAVNPLEPWNADRSGSGIGLAFFRWGVEANRMHLRPKRLRPRMCLCGRSFSGDCASSDGGTRRQQPILVSVTIGCGSWSEDVAVPSQHVFSSEPRPPSR
jgi:hypothetical protein